MTTNNLEFSVPIILGLDPGRDKCGIAIMSRERQIAEHQVVDSAQAIAVIAMLLEKYNIDLIVIGDGTTSKNWRSQIKSSLAKEPKEIEVVTVNEANSTVEARDRYWEMYSPRGLQRIIPQGLRVPPRPVDDIVAIILIERYLANLKKS